MKIYKAKECRCWVEYPNPNYKYLNQWKCVDCYKNIKPLDGHRSKTRCVLIEKGEQE